MSNTYEQINLFSSVLPTKKITKPIRLIEFFAGIGSQFKALKELTDQVESYKICEWSWQSVASYNAIHLHDYTDYAAGMSKEELIDKVFGISSNYKNPLNKWQLARKSLDWLRTVYNNNCATHNLINIMDVHGSDLNIVDTDKYEYVLTYSFPCQDLSLSGQRKGMEVSQAEGGTRSGLLWEVDRILHELERERESLPSVLIMENVIGVMDKKNIATFKKFQDSLKDLGYTSYTRILNSKDYLIPQNRRRCFMVSVLGDYNYEWVSRLKLKYHLLDFTEHNVNEKYYLSDKMIRYIVADNAKWTGNNNKAVINKSIASTINTAEGQRRCDASNYICEEVGEDYDLKKYGTFIPIRNATKKGYLLAEEGDGVDISSRMETHRGTVQKGIVQTIKTTCEVGVVVKDKRYLRIRRLTPKECYRLMGFTDNDYDHVVAAGSNDTTLFHQSGDSIVVPCLIAVFAPLLGKTGECNEILHNYVERIKNG